MRPVCCTSDASCIFGMRCTALADKPKPIYLTTFSKIVRYKIAIFRSHVRYETRSLVR